MHSHWTIAVMSTLRCIIVRVVCFCGFLFVCLLSTTGDIMKESIGKLLMIFIL